jgi:flagellar motor switch protein FliN/FliY
MPIHQVLRLARGAITELDSSEEDKVRNLANNMPVAKGLGGRQRQPHAVDRRGLRPPLALSVHRRFVTSALAPL